jgi:hypothetical protein
MAYTIFGVWIGRSDRIGSAIQKMEVDRNAESDPIFQRDLDLEYDPRKSDRSEACTLVVSALSHPASRFCLGYQRSIILRKKTFWSWAL